MKNIFFIIIDALRMDSLNDDMSGKIAPNLKKMCSKGLVEKIITNGQVTKFVVPSIFTQTFPLDYGGYNYGIDKMSEAINDSLKRLQTDYIDLYQLHWPERNTNMFGKLGYEHKDKGDWNKFEDVLGNLQKFVKEGKIRDVGLSNETPWGVSKYLEIAKEKNLPRMMSVQNPYSLLNRTYEIGLAEVSIREQIGLLAYSPLASGYLSGKYRNETYPKGSRMERDWEFWKYRYNTPNLKNAVEEYYKISEKYNLDMSQMSLKFCELQYFTTSVIIGATTMEQLKTNIESVNVNLSDEIIKEINEIQKIYPNPCP